MEQKWIMHMCMLVICGVEDWREKRVSLWKIRLYALLVIIMSIVELKTCEAGFYAWGAERIAGSIPGIGLLILGKLTDEAVGYADGFIALFIGFSMGFWEGVGILATALICAFAAVICIVLREGRQKDREIAFVPFLFLGMAGAGLWIGS